MTAFQFVALGMMIAWTLCLIILAVLMWRAPDIDEAEKPRRTERSRALSPSIRRVR
jgi:hypothetical protein